MTTTDAKLDRILEQHAELRESVNDMRAFLLHPRPEPGTEEASTWANRLAEKLLQLHQQVNQHFHEEEASGFLRELHERFPGSTRLGCPGAVFRLRTRLPWVTPDGPGRLPTKLQLGVAATTLPQRSATTQVVVS